MSYLYDVRIDISQIILELHFTASRSSGPGGQHVNKASTRVTARLPLRTVPGVAEWQRNLLLQRLAGRIGRDGVLQVSCSETRSQAENRQRVPTAAARD